MSPNPHKSALTALIAATNRIGSGEGIEAEEAFRKAYFEACELLKESKDENDQKNF